MKTTKKLLAIMLALVMTLGVTPMLALADEVPAGYTPIYTKEDLDNIRLNMSGKYILMNDIIFTDEDYAQGGDFYNSGKGWSPIGTSSAPFIGTMNGNGFGVYNLVINAPDSSNVGLFGQISNALISDITVVGDIVGSSNCGLLVGIIAPTSNNYTVANITGCKVKGTVNGSSNLGGIAGKADTSYVHSADIVISLCLSDVNIAGANCVGGVVGIINGDQDNNEISQCLVKGNIQGTTNVGGIIGKSTGTSVTSSSHDSGYRHSNSILCCANQAELFGTTNVGGIVGQSLTWGKTYSYSIGSGYHTSTARGYNKFDLKITNSYNSGSITATEYAGGIIGNAGSNTTNTSLTYGSSDVSYTYSVGLVSAENNKGAIIGGGSKYTVYNTYYDDACIEDATDTNGIAKSEDQLRKQSTFAGWDFNTVWTIDSTAEYRYPTLRGVSDLPEIVIPNACDHANAAIANAADASCTKDGYTGDLVCPDCGETLETGGIIPATGHTPVTVKGKAATCTEDGLTDGVKCSVCNEVLTAQEVILATGHTPVTVKGKAADCTEDGLTDGVKCSVCNEVLTAQEVIPATGHTPVTVKGKAATCTEDGLTDGVKCYVCNEVLTAQTVIRAGHRLVLVPAKEATDKTDGNIEYYICSVCGKCFADASGTREIDEASTVIPKTTPDTPHKCSYCGKVHTGFFGSIVQIFHTILYFFKNLFK